MNWHTYPKPPQILPTGKITRISFIGDEEKLFIDERNQVFRFQYQSGRIEKQYWYSCLRE